jgi:hypothetical protein
LQGRQTEGRFTPQCGSIVAQFAALRQTPRRGKEDP